MNNEETMIMQPKNNEETMITQPKKSENNVTNADAVEIPTDAPMAKEKESGNGKKVAAAVFGGAGGGAAAAAVATEYYDSQKDEVEAQVDEAPAATASAQPAEQSEQLAYATDTQEEVPVFPDDTEEPDYTNHGGADPVVQVSQSDPNIHQTGYSPEGGDTNEVQILGIEEGYTEDGAHVEEVYLTNGETIAVVADVTGDDVADVLWVDQNINGVVDEGEVEDISDQHIQMTQFEQAYEAQQMEEMQMAQMEQDSYNNDAYNEMDYNNDADMSFT